MSNIIRSVKNVTKGYSNVQVKVREATTNDPWGPTGSQMSEIAQRTFNGTGEFYEIVDMLDKRLNDKGKNWRHVLKALKVLDYCLHEGSETVVTWGRQNIYVIKTLREFQYVDEEGKDVGQNVRVAAKEITSLILDEERLRAERSDRKSWKSRVTGIEEFGPPPQGESSSGRRRPRERANADNPEDAEYRLAIEASLTQEEEDRRRRQSQTRDGDDDDELEKALKLSREEDEARKQRESASAAAAAPVTAASLFDDTPATQPQPTGFNQGYQQGSAVDFFANPIDQNQMQPQQQAAYMGNMYTGFPQNQPTGFQNGFQTGYQNGYSMQQPQATGFDAFGQQQQQQQQQQQVLAQQPTSFNPYAQQMQPQPDAASQPGSNNPWATGNSSLQTPQSLQVTPTGSNNPFASNSAFGRPQTQKVSSLGSLPEQQRMTTFNQPNNSFSQPQQQPTFGQTQPQKELSEHETRLNALLSSGDGMDTFGNTGNLRLPAQHTAPGTFVNSAGANLNQLTTDATGNNPFMRQQFTGMPQVTYNQMPAATGPAGMNGGYGAQASNPFAQRQQQNGQNADLIQL